jgi:hypothetical protein
MAYFALSGISGCHSPITGTTTGYDVMYNDEKIISYMKKDMKIEFEDIFMVSVLFENYTQLYKFKVIGDRDTFYASLP